MEIPKLTIVGAIFQCFNTRQCWPPMGGERLESLICSMSRHDFGQIYSREYILALKSDCPVS
jgi:hypothetical protein